jgi:RNA polymerase sigma factor (sigma-70 family)
LKKIRFDKFHEEIFCSSKYNFEKYNSDEEQKKILELLQKIVKNELTNRQRLCLNLYFSNMLNTVQISYRLGIYPSTVCRHLSKAKKRIQKLMRYYYSKFKD